MYRSSQVGTNNEDPLEFNHFDQAHDSTSASFEDQSKNLDGAETTATSSHGMPHDDFHLLLGDVYKACFLQHFAKPPTTILPQKLIQPFEMNGELCTHHMDHVIYGNKNTVTQIYEASTELKKNAPTFYAVREQGLKSGRCCIIALDSSRILEGHAYGIWGPHELSQIPELARFETGILVDVRAILQPKTTRPVSLPGAVVHEHIHEAFSVKMQELAIAAGKSIPRIHAFPFYNAEKGAQLRQLWFEAYEVHVASLPNRTLIPGTPGYQIFNQPMNAYKAYQEGLNQIEHFRAQLTRPITPYQRSQLLSLLRETIEGTKTAFIESQVEIPSCLMEAKIQFGQKAINSLAPKVARNLDAFFEKKIFCESSMRLASARYGSIVAKNIHWILLGVGLGLEIVSAVKNQPHREGAYNPYIAHGILEGSTRFVSGFLLSHFLDSYTHGCLEDLYIQGATTHSTEECSQSSFSDFSPDSLHPNIPDFDHPDLHNGSAEAFIQQAVASRMAAFMMFSMSGGRAIVHPTQFSNSSAEAAYLKSLLPGFQSWKEIENGIADYFKSRFDEGICSDEAIIGGVVEDLVTNLGNVCRDKPEGYANWSMEKKAEWTQQNIITQAEKIMDQSIDQHRQEAVNREIQEAESRKLQDQWGRYLGDRLFWGASADGTSTIPSGFNLLTSHLSETDRRLLKDQLSSIPQSATSTYSEKRTEPEQPVFPPIGPRINPHLFRRKPLFTVDRPSEFKSESRIPSSYLPPLGDIRIDHNGSGFTLYGTLSTTSGAGLVIRADLLNPQTVELIAIVTPIALAAAFVAIVALNLKSDIDRSKGIHKAMDIETNTLADTSKIYSIYTNDWVPIIVV